MSGVPLDSVPLWGMFIVAFAGVLYLIVDLDRGGEGLLRVDQTAMTDLQQSMRASASETR